VAIRALGLPADIDKRVHQNRLLRIAREAAQTAVNDLRDYERARRHATLVALMVDTAATLTDEIVDLHDRMIGSFFAKAKHAYDSLAESGDSINEKVRLFAQGICDGPRLRAQCHSLVPIIFNCVSDRIKVGIGRQ
jgi:hypothetical protein